MVRVVGIVSMARDWMLWSKRHCRAILCVGTVVAALSIPVTSVAAPATRRNLVKRIRFWTAPDHTRVVCDMSSESRYSIKTYSNPPKIAINIPGGRFARGVKGLVVNDGVIERIRINRLRSGAQIVLDLKKPVEFRDFALKPYKGRPHRIVIDVEKVLSSAEVQDAKKKASAVARSGDYIVIIDPGHGGSDPGAISRNGLREKDVVLRLAHLVADKIDKYRGFRAVLTRKGDYNVSLQRRIDIARSYGGDCFISLHMNSHYNKRARGSEVYYLSLKGATDKNAQAVAEKENLFLEMGDEGTKFNDDIKEIIYDLSRSNSMYKSSLLAAEIASSLKRSRVLPFRSIKQANFVVLRSVAVPSVLVEAAFLSNRRDEKMIRKTTTLKGLASAIAAGVVSYLRKGGSVDDMTEQGDKADRKRITVHVVSKGETLWKIARRYKMRLQVLMDLNGLKKTGKIRPGQKLKVYR